MTAQTQFSGQLQRPAWHPRSPGGGTVTVSTPGIQKSRVGKGKAKSEDTKGWRCKLRLNKIEKGKHSDLRTRNSTLK